jgi:uncharacterized circularly permuted ATP-grasp superfamily protein/uncharacterized alpha-E superfamily protein
MSNPDLLQEVSLVPSIFSGYTPRSSAYDELIDEAGVMRPHWRSLAAALDQLGLEELDRRLTDARRLLRENGITYTTREDPHDARPWDIDLFPLLFDHGPWRELVAGINQRAKLLDAIIRDIYTTGSLVIRRLFPPELLFASPGFMRSCTGQPVPGDCYLHLYSADVVRAADGSWRVVADRTNAPWGLGYALENRMVTTRMFPGMMRDCRIERLAPFFMALQQQLRDCAPAHRDNPRIVLLSEGSQSSRHFEDAYLARYLNYTLADVGDLAVRDNYVLLKTLGGLLPVDVIFRRLTDTVCDPLEFQGQATHGVPGLLQAVRAGKVAVVNALGSSVVETPALMPYLPALCERLLQQELQLQSVETCWSGTPEGRAELLSGRPDLVHVPTFSWGTPAVDEPRQVPAAQVDSLAARMAKDLWGSVGQVIPVCSTAPVHSPQAVCSAPISLRVFAVRSGDGYHVLPGGLVRVAVEERQAVVGIQRGQVSKDAWVIAATEVAEVTLLQSPNEPARLRRGGAELPSRVADNLFWLGRYAERADAAARMLRTLVTRLADESQMTLAPELTPLIRTLVTEESLPREFLTEDGKQLQTDLEGVLAAAVLDQHRSASCGFFRTLELLSAAADLVRDRLSVENWKILNGLREDMQAALAQGFETLSDLLEMLGQAITGLAAFSGMAAESMTRSQGWRFMDLGRRLERSMHTLTLVQEFVACDAGQIPSLQETMLEVGESLMTYRSRYLANLRLDLVLDLLLTDETNPRAVAFQLAAIEEHVSQLPHDRSEALLSADRRLAINMRNSIRQVDIETLEESRRAGEHQRLDRLLARLAEQLPRLSELVSHRYFVHAGIPRQLVEW